MTRRTKSLTVNYNKEIEKLKKENETLQEGNDFLGIYHPTIDPAPAIKELLERQIKQGKAMVQIVKMHQKIFYIKQQPRTG